MLDTPNEAYDLGNGEFENEVEPVVEFSVSSERRLSVETAFEKAFAEVSRVMNVTILRLL